MDEEQLGKRCGDVAFELKRVSGRRQRWPEDLKAEIMAYAAERRLLGESDNTIVRRLGVWQGTLSRWRRDAEGGHGTVLPVAIVPSHGRSLAASTVGQFELATPAGYRVEGLDGETLAYLLRILG